MNKKKESLQKILDYIEKTNANLMMDSEDEFYNNFIISLYHQIEDIIKNKIQSK